MVHRSGDEDAIEVVETIYGQQTESESDIENKNEEGKKIQSNIK